MKERERERKRKRERDAPCPLVNVVSTKEINFFMFYAFQALRDGVLSVVY